MLIHVDQPGSGGDALKGGFYNCVRRGDKGDDGAVMVKVTFTVEDVHAGDSANCGDDLVNDGAAPPFREIGNAFYNLSHNRAASRVGGGREVNKRLFKLHECAPVLIVLYR
jgi:hypothetical protein